MPPRVGNAFSSQASVATRVGFSACAATGFIDAIKLKAGTRQSIETIAALDCKPGDGYGSLTLEQIFDDYIRPLKIPAYRGAMIGHIREQFIVPVGGKVELDADAGTFRLLEPVFQG